MTPSDFEAHREREQELKTLREERDHYRDLALVKLPGELTTLRAEATKLREGERLARLYVSARQQWDAGKLFAARIEYERLDALERWLGMSRNG